VRLGAQATRNSRTKRPTIRQQPPQTNLPFPQLVAAAPPSGPHSTVHDADVVHVTVQAPSHLTSHDALSLHATVLPSPTSNLHEAEDAHVPVESAPALRSHLLEEMQSSVLPSPPCPLHSDESLHVSETAPVPLALHFDDELHDSEHCALPHVVEQSVPATQAHPDAVAHEQPVPVHVTAGALLSPQASVRTVPKKTKPKNRRI